MRSVLILGFAAAALGGVVFAQVERPDYSKERREYEELARRDAELRSLPTTCVDMDGATHALDDTTTVGRVSLRCVPTYGERVTTKGAAWIVVPAPAAAPTGRR